MESLIEGLAGVRPHPGMHRVDLFPQLPRKLEWFKLEDCRIGQHRLTLEHRRTGKSITTTVTHSQGDAPSNFGFWTPGPLNDGAMSWGFQPRQVGTEWNPATRDLPRGAWPVCGEADHGLVAGIAAASTVLFDDPLFGLVEARPGDPGANPSNALKT